MVLRMKKKKIYLEAYFFSTSGSGDNVFFLRFGNGIRKELHFRSRVSNLCKRMQVGLSTLFDVYSFDMYNVIKEC